MKSPPASREKATRRRAGPAAGAAARTSPAGLEAAALDYLARYSSSRTQLRRVLERRIRRWAAAEGADPAAARAGIQPLLAKLERLGLLDDARFALGHAASLHGRGRSLRRIRAALAQRGVGRDAADAALASVETAHADADFLAAIAHARRRKLGPYRAATERAARRTGDLAALARAGFSYEIARRVIAAASADELEAAARGESAAEAGKPRATGPIKSA